MTTPAPVPGAVPPPGCPAHTGHDNDAPGTSTAAQLYGPEFAADPGATYARLRKHGSVTPVEIAPGVRASLVIGYETALEVLRSPERFSKDPRRWRALANGTVPADSPVVPMMMYRPNALWTDGDDHARLRGAITDSLARVDPNALRGYVEHSADTLIDRIGPKGEADLLGEYGAILPLLVFNRMFGCPPDIGEKLVFGMSGIFDADADSEKANMVLVEGVAELVSLKRKTPKADVTSWMMAHPAQLTDEEMMHQLVVLMGAGTEPQQNLICNGLRLLLSDDRFAGDLAGGSLPVEDALDEVLWTDPPMANYAIHYPLNDLTLDGTLLREGEPILISLAAANTDPGLVADRRGGNRAHLAWSAGPHTCPAKSPARLIAAVAVEKLLDRLPDVQLATGVERLEWRQGPFHRALAALPVRFPPITVRVATDTPSGVSEWNPNPAPSSSTPPAVTSTEREPASANTDRQHWWSFLGRWWRGQ
ncbi:cytochrome P450 [Actinacidiphila oryziradicis]|uniref:cytochrome P450 n=1 Tax=Actinacidiphila oryziradicis TaxID=2571141 RepID=UPI001FEC3421|nr:cytochrome P450 [Actinacidiphila oryziradicis]